MNAHSTRTPPLAWSRFDGDHPRVSARDYTVLAAHYADDVLATSLVAMDIDPDLYVHDCTVLDGAPLDADTARELVADVERSLRGGGTRWRVDGGEVRS